MTTPTVTMHNVMQALAKVRGAPVLTSNQCADLAQALNDIMDPCKNGHMPIAWDGRVYCEVCNQPLYDVETKTAPPSIRNDRVASPSLYIQQCGRAYRMPKDWQTNELVRLIMDRCVQVQDPEVYGLGWTF